MKNVLLMSIVFTIAVFIASLFGNSNEESNNANPKTSVSISASLSI